MGEASDFFSPPKIRIFQAELGKTFIARSESERFKPTSFSKLANFAGLASLVRFGIDFAWNYDKLTAWLFFMLSLIHI